MDEMTDKRERWALILGASSGFGGASGLSLARAGYGIVGVHLDLRGTIANANQVRDEMAATGVPVVVHNINAEPESPEVSHEQLDMTSDVMAHSLVYCTRDLYNAGLLADGSRVFAMT